MTRLVAGAVLSVLIAGTLFILWRFDGVPALQQMPPVHPITPVALPTLNDSAPIDYAGLHNLVAFHDNFISGSAPEGSAGFQALQDMGVRTIISVDGAAPDVELARSYGLDYIHLPIGYDGFDEQRTLQLTRATRDALADGPVYIHCHHGKHRSAGAAAVIAVSLGYAQPDDMIDRMRLAGTAENYTGLYECAADAQPIHEDVLAAVPADFPSVALPQGLVKAMVEIDHITEHLKAIESARWSVPEDHPDLVPVAQAGQLADLFRFLESHADTQSEPDDFRSLLRSSQLQAQNLEQRLLDEKADQAELSAIFDRIMADCKSCHTAHRD